MDGSVIVLNILRVNQLKNINNEKNGGYKAFYKFAYEYHMIIPGQKTLEKDAAILLIQILTKKSHPISKKFIAFLKQSERQVINRDQWAHMISLFTLLEKGEEYDASGACKIWQVTIE